MQDREYELTFNEKVSWITLLRSKNVSNKIFFNLIDLFKGPENALDRLDEYYDQYSKNLITASTKEEAMREMEACHNDGAQMIFYPQKEYSKLLKEIYDPPPLIFAKGNIDLIRKYALAIVGARSGSAVGQSMAGNLSEQMGKRGFVIASGMARGIDAAAHIGAINTGTIAVLAGGIDHIYPRENTKLYHAISNKGLVISEFPVGFRPNVAAFPQRNRLIAGLTLGTLVVEAGIKSGTLITARMSRQYDRDVFAIPGSPMDLRNKGSNALLKDSNAFMVENVNDIIENINIPDNPDLDLSFMEEPQQDFAGFAPKTVDEDIDKIRDEILTVLSYMPMSIDEVVGKLQVSAKVVNIALLKLELADKIYNQNGKVCLKA